jgi:vacuolar-type H+-ATPase subunit E/Vma4
VSLQDLLGVLESEADAEGAAVQAEARREAEQTVAAARIRADALVAELVRRAVAEAEAESALVTGAARGAGDDLVRSAREKALSTVHDRAVAALAEVRSGPESRSVLAGCLREALAVLPGATAVHVDPRDEKGAAEVLRAAQVSLPIVADLATEGGVVLVDDLGRRLDNTLSTRLEGAWPDLRPRVAGRWEDPS